MFIIKPSGFLHYMRKFQLFHLELQSVFCYLTRLLQSYDVFMKLMLRVWGLASRSLSVAWYPLDLHHSCISLYFFSNACITQTFWDAFFELLRKTTFEGAMASMSLWRDGAPNLLKSFPFSSFLSSSSSVLYC